ncbi:MAG: hypothetical protein HOI95_02615 [Chromatiales bacterium]|jgi:hypothetical protein|nr:hypothetical protein [Chromatiales bacterium]
MIVLPMAPFLVDSDLTPVGENIEGIVSGLTQWRPSTTETGIHRPALVPVDGNNYESAYDLFNRMALASTWGDGLPLVPPTMERVDWILSGSPVPRDHSFGKLMPRGGLATMDTVAGALAMAGGRPEYLPVLAAAVDALLDDHVAHDKAQATSGSTFPVVVVNGPIAKDIGLNSGFGLLGPDPQHPAGASIGRALRLLLQNVGGALPGVGTMALFGAMRYTNAIFAEDEAGLPPGWRTLGEEHGHLPPGANGVTVFMATGASNVMRRGVGKEEAMQEAEQGLLRVAKHLGVPNAHYPRSWSRGTPGLLLLPPVVAQQLVGQGWSDKASVRKHLWQHSMIAGQTVAESGMRQWIEADDDPVARASVDLDPWPICQDPDQLMLAVAGGNHPTHGFWMQAWGPSFASRTIGLPGNWKALLAQAEADIGPTGDACVIS